MANAAAPFGLRPVMMLDGSPWNGQTIRCQFAAAESTATFIGDIVSLDGTNTGTEGVPTVIQMAAATTVGAFGVVVAVEFDADDLTSIYRTASTQRACYVVPALDAIFEIQSDGTGEFADIGNTADWAPGAGNTTTGLSTGEIADATMGTGANLHIMGFVNRPDNDVASANANWLVRLNESQLRGDGTAGA
jgi:hypothetical protein